MTYRKWTLFKNNFLLILNKFITGHLSTYIKNILKILGNKGSAKITMLEIKGNL